MALEITVPRFSYPDLCKRAEDFLREFNPQNRVPIPIEEIVEIQLGMDVIPVPGLLRDLDIDGFIGSDLQSITVDEFVYKNRVSRYRFTLAHELAHKILHARIYEQFAVTGIQDWERFQDEVNEKDYAILEGQANWFAGLVLVPPQELARVFAKVIAKAKSLGVDFEKAGDMALPYIAKGVAAEFEVSAEVGRIRIQKDGLWKLSGNA